MKPAILPGQPEPIPIPDWANWLAQDADGTWYAYKTKPDPLSTCWIDRGAQKLIKVLKVAPAHDGDAPAEPNPNWKSTLRSI